MINLRSLSDNPYLVDISNIHALTLPGGGAGKDIVRLLTMNSPERQHDQIFSAPAPEHLKLIDFRITSYLWAANWYLHALGYKEELNLVKILEALNEFMSKKKKWWG